MEAIYDIHDNGEIQVAVGANGLILVSGDGGASWSQKGSGTTNALHGVAYGYAFDTPRWVIVGENGIILTSADANSWTVRTPFTAETLYAVAWGGVFLAVGAGGTLGLSADLGASWEGKGSGTAVDLFDIAIDLGLYTIVGDADTVIVGSLGTLEKEVLITEGVGVAASDLQTGTFAHSLSEALESADGYGWKHIDTSLVETEGGEVQHVFLSEGVGTYDYFDLPTGAFGHGVTELFEGLGTFLAHGAFQHFAVSALTVTDASERERVILRQAVETLNASGAFSVQQVWNVVETVRSLGSAYSSGVFNHAVIQKLTAKERTVVSWLLALTEGVAASATASQKFEAVLRVVEKLSLSGVFSSRLQAVSSVVVSVLLAEQVAAGKGAEATEGLTMTPELSSKYVALCAQIEQTLLNEAAQQILTLRLPVTETIDISAGLSVGQVLQELIEEGVAFALSFGLAGESYRGWVMNTRNFAVTEYAGYPFNSLGKIGDVLLGANGNGLYRLDGDDDDGAPIAARIALGATDFGRHEVKRLERVYLGFRADGDLLLKVVTDENVERWYTVRGTTEKAHRRAVDNWTKGVQGNYWQFELQNTEGEDFEIDAFHFVPIYLTRRI